MNGVDLAFLLHETMFVAVKLSAPALLAALLIGVIISLLQAVTQINEATLAFVPKVIAIGMVLFATGSFMTMTLIAFGHHVFDQMLLAGAN